MTPKDSSFRLDHERLRSELDLNVRRMALYGAVYLTGIMYLAGICVAVGAVAAIIFEAAATRVNLIAAVEASWHLAVATLTALFSVPTVLAIAIIRSVGINPSEPATNSVHSMVGDRIANWVESAVTKK